MTNIIKMQSEKTQAEERQQTWSFGKKYFETKEEIKTQLAANVDLI